MEDFKLVVVEKYEFGNLNVIVNIFGLSQIGSKEKIVGTKGSALGSRQGLPRKQKNRAVVFL